jgi:hypothetical protein
MIKHIVFWRLKNRDNVQTRDETARAIKQKIDAMRGRIPGLLHIEGGVDFSRTADSYDLVLYAELESQEALAGYHVHPVHQEFKAFVSSRQTERLLVDYEASRQ